MSEKHDEKGPRKTLGTFTNLDKIENHLRKFREENDATNMDNPLTHYMDTFEKNWDDHEDIMLHIQYLSQMQGLLSEIATMIYNNDTLNSGEYSTGQ